MCDVVVPMPKCSDCVAVEVRLLKEKLRVTPEHPLIEARLLQLSEDELLTAEVLSDLREQAAAAVLEGEDGDVVRSLISEESRRLNAVRGRELVARSVFVKIAHTEDFSGYPLDAVEAVASHPNSVVRRRLASNPSTPVEVLELLARDYDRDVLGAVMMNPNHNWDCFFRVAANPHAVGGLAEVFCLTEAMLLPPSSDERDAVDRALAGLTVSEKVRVSQFLAAGSH